MIHSLFSKKTYKNICLILSAIFITIFTVEAISLVILTIKSENISPVLTKNTFHSDNDQYLGYILKKNTTYTGTKSFSDGRIIYNATYTTDNFRRRDIGQKFIKNNRHLIIFGCSQMYGDGLNDSETLQYKLFKKLPQYNIYNYSVSGYGPQHMLAYLQKGNLIDEVSSKEGLAIYGLIDNHIGRTIANTRHSWLFSSPYYYMDKNGSLKRNESFLRGMPTTTNFYKIVSMSSFAQLNNLKFPTTISKEHIKLTYEIIAESKHQYEKQFKGNFYVLLLSSEPTTNIKRLISLLEKNNIPVLYPKFDTNKPQYKIEGDGHNSAEFNELLSEQLAEYFNNSTKL